MDFSPKANFAKGLNAQAWTNTASSALFVEAAGVAMLQMQVNLGASREQWEAVGHCLQMEGARIFLTILMNLTTPVEERKPVRYSDNLNHAV